MTVMSTDFRIPNQMLVTNSLAQLAETRSSKLSDLQDQASSLKRLRRPSDAPADVVSAMSLHAGIDRNDQFSRNLDDASAGSAPPTTRSQSTVTQLQKVNDLVVQAANPAIDATSRASIATQIDSIRKTLIGVANTQYAGRPIFGGTASGGVAYDASGQLRRDRRRRRAQHRARPAGAGQRERRRRLRHDRGHDLFTHAGADLERGRRPIRATRGLDDHARHADEQRSAGPRRGRRPISRGWKP